MPDSNGSIKQQLNSLTPMEKRVLQLISHNKTSREIADQLFISYRTVQNHRYNISRKLNLKGSNSLLEFSIQYKQEIQTHSDEKRFKPGVDKIRKFKLRKSLSFLAIPVFILIAFLVFQQIDRSATKKSESFESNERKHQRLAVMPVQFIGPDSTNKYLADGLTEELINRISSISGLGVIARTSVMPYRNRNYNIETIGIDLDVDAIIEGSIQRQDSLIRINVQVIDVESEETIWSGSYDRMLRDLFSMQREISRDITAALNIELFVETLSGSNPNIITDEEAQLAYLRGRFFFNKHTLSGFEKAILHFKESIRIDPDFAHAWAGLADTYTWMSNFGLLLPDSAYEQSRKAAKIALSLNPNLSQAHTSLGAVYLLYDWNFTEAENILKKAINLNPGDVVAHRLLALYYYSVGNIEDALIHTSINLKLDPLAIFSNAVHGRTLYFARDYENSYTQLQKTLELDPSSWLVHAYLGELLLETGEEQEAMTYLEKAVDLSPGNWNALSKLAYGFARTGMDQRARDILKKLVQDPDLSRSFSFQILLIYAALGDEDLAFEWMQKAYDNRHDFMLDLKMDPKLNPLRDDGRFERFVEMMGLKGGM